MAEPFSTQPATEDVGQEERPALLAGPLLRDGVEAGQGVADLGDGRGDEVAFFVPHADFDGALATAAREPGHSVEQCGAAVLVAAVAFRVLFSESYLSLWLFVTAAAMFAKEWLNYWFEVRRDKRKGQMVDEIELEAQRKPDLADRSSEPSKNTRKAAQNRPRARTGSTEDEEERRHAGIRREE